MHPFFQAINYPWHLPEAVELYNQLDQAYGVKAEIDTIYRKCGIYLIEIPAIDLDQTTSEIWKDVLQKLSQKLRLEKFCQVLQALDPVQPVADALKAVTELKSAIDPEVIDIGRLVLDRKPLRGYLHILANPNEPVKVLLVRGETKSGKSYTRVLFEAIAKQQGAVPVILIKSVVVTLDDVLDPLFATAGDINAKPQPSGDMDLKKEVSEEGDTTRDAWFIKVCNKLLATAQKHNKVVWVGIDDLGFRVTEDANGEKKQTSIMDPKIRHFFNQFVNHMTTPAFQNHFRLLLINYPLGKLPTVWDQTYLKDETLNELDITQDHIEEVMNTWYKINDGKVSESEVRTTAAAIIAKIDNVPKTPDLPPRLQRLKDEVVKILTKS